jgi:hypothetical protein
VLCPGMVCVLCAAQGEALIFNHISFTEKCLRQKLQRKLKTQIVMFNNVVFNKVFIIQPMVLSGRVINTLLIRNTQGDGVTQDCLTFLFFQNRSFLR